MAVLEIKPDKDCRYDLISLGEVMLRLDPGEGRVRENLEILDRVGGGDSFASGLIYGLMAKGDPQAAVEYGAAHGALAMTTPGDTSMATLAEVEKIMAGGGSRVER